ncbi:MAG: hypothetical protein HGA78_04885 [Nitrospirales bacterium]|nr:hypothetical protein [Nitrospirales bacterium]
MDHWYCIQTKPKSEDHVQRLLLHVSDIEVFNPKYRRQRFVNGRLQSAVETFFPSYLFARFDPIEHFHILKYTRGISQILSDGSGIPSVVDDEIIETVRSRIRDGCVFLDPSEPEFHSGDQIIVREGPLKGLTGVFLEETKPMERVMILLNAITYQARIEMDKEFLSRV